MVNRKVIVKMKVRATIIHISTPPRMGPLAATLAKHGHVFTDQKISDADLWLVDCMWPHKIDDAKAYFDLRSMSVPDGSMTDAMWNDIEQQWRMVGIHI
jgi:hypothetical protein